MGDPDESPDPLESPDPGPFPPSPPGCELDDESPDDESPDDESPDDESLFPPSPPGWPAGLPWVVGFDWPRTSVWAGELLFGTATCQLGAALLCVWKAIVGGMVGVVIDCPIDHVPPGGLATGATEAKPSATELACAVGPTSENGKVAPPAWAFGGGAGGGGGVADAAGLGGLGGAALFGGLPGECCDVESPPDGGFVEPLDG